MTETPATETPPAPAPAAPPAESEPSRLDKLEAAVAHLAELIKGSGSKAETDEGASVAEEVKRELARLKAAEDRKARQDGDSKRLADVEAKVKTIAEKAPREYRRVTSWMWGGDE